MVAVWSYLQKQKDALLGMARLTFTFIDSSTKDACDFSVENHLCIVSFPGQPHRQHWEILAQGHGGCCLQPLPRIASRRPTESITASTSDLFHAEYDKHIQLPHVVMEFLSAEEELLPELHEVYHDTH